MAPLIALCTTFMILRGIGWLGVPMFNHWHPALQGAVVVMFLLTASAHWGKRRADLVQMVPRGLVHKEKIVTWTGILEIAGAVGLLIPGVAWIAAAGLLLMLIVMFPANVHAAREKLTIGGKAVWPVFPRLVLQLLFITAIVLASPWFG
ncbi:MULTISPECIES: DoxX family protein [unclassified Paenibacillus]|uniref:DoxX family protein n=1 Tax=unclassified Paenibacillus TaxID=185978 RepID=UPI0030F7824B